MHLTLIGEDPTRTVVSFDDYFARIARGRNSTLFTPTVQINADDFVARNLTIEMAAKIFAQLVKNGKQQDRGIEFEPELVVRGSTRSPE